METYPEPDTPEEDEEIVGLEEEVEEADEALGAEPLDLDALVRKARRSRRIAESDVQSILASVSEEQAEQLYERLQKLNIRIVADVYKRQGRHHLDGAAGQPEQDRPHGVGADVYKRQIDTTSAMKRFFDISGSDARLT